ncbi:hypothetical protein NBRC10512_001954 [Rhodotorula toruloides]|uniref:RHTO0S03e11584g1_1 n=2 Tax=Rhodotorula toruloides TaxID=5286 RepID=A0A061ANA4_RHOTO|nr:uncharacterized protein RHTO_00546 [Rhodotorula toruloides NP11]EMS26118.1 hypothetical protein RHTO_00546 [Rhodotorula toruloides NP11]CDR38632.1 RHTO0S03e11584g1_1 [Rhodotorula toruloides]
MADAAIPAAQLAALRHVALVRTHAAVLVLLFQSIFYGTFVGLAWEYYRRFRRRDGERLFLQVFVAVLLVVSTAFLALCAAVAYQYISQLVANGGTLAFRPTIAATVQPFLLTVFSAVAEVYWVYRAVQVARSWFSRALAAGLWILSLAAFSGHCSIVLRMRMGETFSTRRTLDYLLAGTWLFLADSFFCAGVLVYELVYKRRNELAKSSLVQQFTALALKTSLAIVIFVLIGAIAITHAFVYGSLVSGQVSLAMANLFSFASCCCVAISLLQRCSLRNQYSQDMSRHDASNFGAPASYAYPPMSAHRPVSTSFGRIDFGKEGDSKMSSGSEVEKRSAEKDGRHLSAARDSAPAITQRVLLPRRVATVDDVEQQQAERRLKPLRPWDLVRSKSSGSLRRGGVGTTLGVMVNVEVERSIDHGEEEGAAVREGRDELV